MIANWESKPLKDVIELVIDHRGKTPKKLGFEDFQDIGYPVLSAKHVKTDNLVNSESMRYAHKEMYDKWMKTEVQEGDIVLTSEAPMGEAFYLDGKTKYVLGQRVFGIRPNQKYLNPHYLLSWLTSLKGEHALASRASGSTVLGIKQSELLKIRIDLPPIPIQTVIASIRHTITKKIQLNTQINQTLEAMAQAIFKSWFMDFDPVRAKRQVLYSGGSIEDAERAAMRVISSKTNKQLDEMGISQPDEFAELQRTASLLPSKLIDSKLGEIPEGWEVSTIENICWLNQNSISKKDAPEKVEYVDLGNTKWGEIQATSIYDFENAPSRARRILKRNDTIIGTVRPRNGSYAYIYDDGLIGSTGFAVLTPKGIVFSEFLYFCATNEKNIERLGNLADGGAYPAVNYQLILNTPCVMPNCELEKNNVINSFHRIASFITSKVYENYTQNQTLAELRDTLLPKLLSGELDVNGLVEMQDD